MLGLTAINLNNRRYLSAKSGIREQTVVGIVAGTGGRAASRSRLRATSPNGIVCVERFETILSHYASRKPINFVNKPKHNVEHRCRHLFVCYNDHFFSSNFIFFRKNVCYV